MIIVLLRYDVYRVVTFTHNQASRGYYTQLIPPISARIMSSSATRSLTDSINVALRKIITNVDGVKATATDAKHVAEGAARVASSNATILSNLETALSNALTHIKALEARIATLEQHNATAAVADATPQ